MTDYFEDDIDIMDEDDKFVAEKEYLLSSKRNNNEARQKLDQLKKDLWLKRELDEFDL